MKAIQLKNITKSYDDTKILENFNLQIPHNEITCIIGPSGSGKSTILNLLSELLIPDSGEILNLNDKIVSYVFQSPRLLPWKTVKDNMKFVLDNKIEKNKLDEYIDGWLDAVELLDYKEYYPNQMSGGMKQRLALARGFAVPGNLLLMDEPFKGLDAPLRFKMVELIKKLWEKQKKTIVFVTHDIQEALLLGHSIIALGKKPVKIIENLTIDIPLNERKIGCVRLAKLEGYLFDLVEEGSLYKRHNKMNKHCCFENKSFLNIGSHYRKSSMT
ncbi:ABC transporter ATP-binding protein [Caldisalinibacter kiritimatiensis]|uniref:Sulfonate ABC transporter, ATP-binding subunit SsuB n=1 Tax=Caldisalinibacter kiritimatiensis TaxID=1304284 RepID=R1ARY3_9FIRM|nr:ABC transporter ATP-binding protein [Caldisalinibacter kiritimatiensis]EOC99902.1 Sulfonate ABC transporter, ATP-binding subunit SsuB [Caldisalinibacter kiritimatiensis]